MDEKTIAQKLKEGWIRILMVQEIAGFPEAHVLETMDQMNGNLSATEGVSIIDRKVHEPKQVREGIWSMFAEIELVVKDFPTMLIIIFGFMPSSIEIIEPLDKLTFPVPELTGAINDLISKLHHMDATAKKHFAAYKVLERKLKEKESKQ